MGLFKKSLTIIGMLGSLTGCLMMPKAAKGPAADFKHLQRPSTPNSYLLCPINKCKHSDGVAPVFQVSKHQLKQALETFLKQQPRTTLIKHWPDLDQYRYIQRSLIFRFPDIIDFKLVELNSKQSSLYIYSHAVYGHSDFGVNKHRVNGWLSKIKKILR